MKYLFAVLGLVLSWPAAAGTLDLELRNPDWAKQTVVELGTCVSGSRGQLEFGTTFDIRSVPATITRYSIAGVPNQPVCIRLSWFADGVELVSPEIAVALPPLSIPGTLQLLAAQTIIRISAIPTGAGVVSSKFRDGDDGTGGIPLTWAPIPDFLDKPDGTAFAVDLRSGYLTEAGSPAATLSGVGSVTNWSISGNNLAYDGSGVGGGVLIARATRNADVSDSLPFTVSSVEVNTGPDCLTDFSCSAVDSGTCAFSLEDAGATQVISATGNGACTVTKSISSHTDRRLTLRVLSGTTFGDQNQSGGGGFFARGPSWSADYRTIGWYPKIGPVTMRYDVTGASVAQVCTADALPEYIDMRYESSVTGQSVFRGNDGTNWTQCGDSIDDGAISSGIYGMWCKAHGGTETVCRFQVVNDSTTIPATPNPPGGPVGDPICVNRPGGPAWCSGVGAIELTPSNLTALQTWQGDDIDVYVGWSGQSSVDNVNGWPGWSNAVGASNFTSALANLPANTMIVLTYFLFPDDVNPGLAGKQSAEKCGASTVSTWDLAESGAWDTHVSNFAEALRAQYVAARPSDPTGKWLSIRWGHELNGTWYHDSICGRATEFKAYWNRSVPLLRAELPDLKMDLSPHATEMRCSTGSICNPRIELEDWLPDDENVNTLTRSVHNEDSNEVATVQEFVTRHVEDYQGRFIGLERLCDTAVAHGWTCGSSEWGSHLTNGGSCTPPEWPSESSQIAFTTGWYNFLASRDPADIAWDANLSTSCQGYYQRRNDTAASDTYLQLWYP